MGDIEMANHFSDKINTKFGQSFLGDISDFVRDNSDPTDLYDDGALIKAVQSIRGLTPEDIFNGAELEHWALEMGYVMAEDG